MNDSGFLKPFQNRENNGRIRHSVYSGSWYPGVKSDLKTMVDQYLSDAVVEDIEGEIVGIVSPHAGYVYSAPIAAHAFKPLMNLELDVVIIMGNAHREGFQGAAIDDVDACSNPLGTVNVDRELAERIVKECPSVHFNQAPHRQEHSLEIQLPFLQRTLKKGFEIIPILFGYNDAGAEEQLVRALKDLLKHKRCVLVASTDLTHFPSYEKAVEIDTKTLEIIASMDVTALREHERATMIKGISDLSCVLCGSTAVTTVMSFARKLETSKGKVCEYANSGDVKNGDRRRVVGYGAVVFTAGISGTGQTVTSGHSVEKPLSPEETSCLLAYARGVLTDCVTGKNPPRNIRHDRLSILKRGVFVSLHKHGGLRGCIGYMEPIKNCMDAVRDNTVSAALRDPRFPAVTPDELEFVDIEISVLTPPETIDSWQSIVIGKHGVVLEKGSNRAVFLPQVPVDHQWNLETTLNYLAMKAGLAADSWRKNTTFKVFEAQVFSENHPSNTGNV